MNQTSILSHIFDTVFGYVREEFDIDGAILMLADEKDGELFVVRSAHPESSPESEMEYARSLRIPLNGSSALARVFQRRKSLYARRIIDSDRAPAVDRQIVRNLRLHWYYAVPLVMEDKAIGLLLVTTYNRKIRLTSDNRSSIDRYCLSIAGGVMSAALADRVRLERERVEQARTESDLLAAITRRASEGRSLDAILSPVYELLHERFGARALGFYRREEAGKILRARFAMRDGARRSVEDFPEEVRSIALEPEAGIVYRTFLRGKIIAIPHITPEMLAQGTAVDRAFGTILGLEWLVYLPLFLKGEIIGMFLIGGPGTRRLRRSEKEFFRRLADQIAGAVHTSGLLSEVEAERERAREAHQDMIVLANTARSINETTDLDRIFDQIIEHLQQKMGVYDVVIQVVDEKAREMRTLRCSQQRSPADIDFTMNLRVPLHPDSGTLYRTYRKQRPFYQPQRKIAGFPSELDRRIVETLRMPSILQVPLVIHGKTIGMIWISWRDERRRLRPEIDAVVRFCDQIAGAVHNSSLLEEVRRAQDQTENERRDAEVLADLARRANQSQDLDAILAAMHEVGSRRFEARTLALYLVSEDRKSLHLRSGYIRDQRIKVAEYPVEMTRVTLASEKGSVAVAFRRQKPLLIKDIKQRELAMSPFDRMTAEYGGFTWVCHLPLVVDGKTMGILTLSGETTTALRRRDVNFCARMASQVAGAVHILDLQLQTERDRAEALALARIARRANESRDLQSILDSITEIIRNRFEADSIGLYTLSSDRRRFELVAGHLKGETIDPANLDPMITSVPVAPEGGTFYRTYRKKTIFHMPRIDPDWLAASAYPLEMKVVELVEAEWLAEVPMLVEGDVIGMILFCGRPSRRLSRNDLDLMERIAAQVSGAVRTLNLQRQTERDRADALTLADLARRANESRGIESIQDAIADIFRDRFAIDSLAIYSVDATRENLELSSAYSQGEFAPVESVPDIIRRIPLQPGSGLLFRIFGKRRVFHLSRLNQKLLDSSPIDAALVQFTALKWLVIAPLLVEGEVVALMLFSSPQERRLTPADLDFSERVVAQVAGAVRMIDLLEETAAAHAKTEIERTDAEALAELAREVNAGSDLSTTLDGILPILRKRFAADSLMCYLMSADRSHLEARAAHILNEKKNPGDLAEAVQRQALTTASGTLPRTVRKRSTFHIHRIPDAWLEEGSGAAPADIELVRAARIQWLTQIPLVVADEVVGVLLFSGSQPNRLDRADLAFCERIAAQVAGAVRTAVHLEEVEQARSESDRLLSNILPAPVAAELKHEGVVEPLYYDSVSVLFTDFVGFTSASENMMPDELVAELDGCFSQFDEVVKRNNLEKLKTIGDAYMCAAGLPELSMTHAIDACRTALEFREFMWQMAEVKKAVEIEYWQIRIGIHSGPVTAGVIGINKFAYDIWGDTVNTASRMESSGAPGKINISGETYELVKRFFDCEPRGKINAKGKGELDMYFLERIKPEFSADADGLLPNERFFEERIALEAY